MYLSQTKTEVFTPAGRNFPERKIGNQSQNSTVCESWLDR